MGSLDARRIAALMVESSNICVEKTVATGVDRDGDFHHMEAVSNPSCRAAPCLRLRG